MKIARASAQEAVSAWVGLQERIRKALTRAAGDSWTEEQLCKHVLLGPGQMVMAVDGDQVVGCLIVEFLPRQRGNCLFVLASAGVDHKRWSGEMNEFLREMARNAGCYCMEAYCGDGVERVIQNYGWKRKAVLMEMVL